MNTYYLALVLKDDPYVIEEYESWHHRVWPEIMKSIGDSGITKMEIYHTGNRLFMKMDTRDGFSFERKAINDKANGRGVEWEELMWKYQQPLPWAKEAEKWMLMKLIFELDVYANH